MTELLPFLPLVPGMALLAAILLAWHCLNHAHAEDWVLHPRPSFPAAGFSVTDLPVDEFLTLERCWLIRRTTAQLDFVADPNWAFWLRVGRSGQPLALSDEPPTSYDQREIRRVDGLRVEMLYSPGGTGQIRWSRNGFDYALTFPAGEIGLPGGLTAAFVRETNAEPR